MKKMPNQTSNRSAQEAPYKKIIPVDIFGMKIDPVTMDGAIQTIFEWLDEDKKACKFVVTPNVDHVVQFQTNTALQASYKKASLVLTDGNPVKWVANLLNINIPETVPGSDLVVEIFEHAQVHKKLINIFLLGAMPGVADRAKLQINEQWPLINIVGTLSPEFGFDKSTVTSSDICDVVNNSNPDILVIGLGAPKQELWVAEYAPQLKVNAALCVGATIDFLAKEKPRAPMWMRKYGLEWLHRISSEPKRLIKRYFVGAIKFPIIVYKEWQNQR